MIEFAISIFKISYTSHAVDIVFLLGSRQFWSHHLLLLAILSTLCLFFSFYLIILDYELIKYVFTVVENTQGPGLCLS